MTVLHKEGVIYKQVKKSRIKLMIVNITLLIFLIINLWSSRPAILNNFNKPFDFDVNKFSSNTNNIIIDSPIEITKEDDTSIPSYAYFSNSYVEDNKYRFSIVFDEVYETSVKYDTHVENYTTGEKETFTNAKVYQGKIDGKSILIISAGNANVKAGEKYTGVFSKVPKIVFSDYSKSLTETQEISEYYLDVRKIQMASETADIMYCIFILLIFLFLTTKLIINYINPYTHTTYRSLSKHGSLTVLIEDVENQVKSPSTYKDGSRIITDGWILEKSTFKLKITKNHMAKGKYE